MKSILFLFLSLQFSTLLFSQSFTVAVLRPGQTAYIGIYNPISCTVERVKCQDIVLTTDNGSIEKTTCNQYIYRPVRVADGFIAINKKSKGQLVKIGEFYLRTRFIPNPIAYIGGMQGDTISKKGLAIQQGIFAQSNPSLSICIDFLVKNFTLIVIRKDEVIFFRNINGNIFNDEIKKTFNELAEGDKVLFSSILVEMGDQTTAKASPIEFIIK